jgi:hypothetical protein
MALISYPLKDEQKESVRQLIEAFSDVWPDSEWGPMHILIGDYNVLDGDIEFCRGFVQAMLNKDEVYKSPLGSTFVIEEYLPHDESELRASLAFLDVLAQIPEEWRDIHAEAFDA